MNRTTVVVASPPKALGLLGIMLALLILGGQGVGAGDLPTGGRVKAVFDGDTIVLETGEHIRYLGIDAPEVAHKDDPGECYGEHAQAANRSYVLHQSVRLEYDRENRDHYGRLLAYVWLADGTCVNETLLRQGFAWFLHPPMGLNRQQEFLEAQREALHMRRGMWGACAYGTESFYVGNPRTQVFHRPKCPMGQKVPRYRRVKWESRWLALEQGYRPCRRCKP